MISVRLMTLCGSIQFRLVPAPAPQFIDVPIRVTEVEAGGDITTKVVHNRRFKLVRFDPPEAAVAADYEEQ